MLTFNFGRGSENDQDTPGMRFHPGLEIEAARADEDMPPGRRLIRPL